MECKNYNLEPFKISSLSICLKCPNINEKCSLIDKMCGTDSKEGRSFVQQCTKFKKPFMETKYEENKVSVDSKADSRVEMMGGGHT